MVLTESTTAFRRERRASLELQVWGPYENDDVKAVAGSSYRRKEKKRMSASDVQSLKRKMKILNKNAQ